jgi:hypothetical protein
MGSAQPPQERMYESRSMMQMPMTTPMMMASRLRRALIIPIKLLIPGIVAADRLGGTCDMERRKNHALMTCPIRALIPAKDVRCLANSDRVSRA